MKALSVLILTTVLFVIKLTASKQYLQLNLIKQSVKTDINALEKTIKFVSANYQRFNVDGALGLTLTEATLLKIIPLIKTKPILFKVLQRLLVQIKDLRVKIERILTNKDEFLFPNKYISILKPKLWIKTNQKQKQQITFLQIQPYLNKTTQNKIQKSKTAHYINHSNIITSNNCLCVILHNIKLINCPILDPKQQNLHITFCQSIIDGSLQPKDINGYPLSHYLLIRQINKRFGYVRVWSTSNKQVNSLTKRLCHLMLKEAATILLGTNTQNIDLYLEHVVLCGLENYFDINFLVNGEKHLINWQQPNGCFGISKEIKKTRRSMNLIGSSDYYCTDHTTGLGMAAISAHLFVTVSCLTNQTFT